MTSSMNGEFVLPLGGTFKNRFLFPLSILLSGT